MNFTEWWTQNKAVYEALNVSKEIARTIWMASVDNYVNLVEITIRRRYK